MGQNGKPADRLKECFQKIGYILPTVSLPVVVLSLLWFVHPLDCAERVAASTSLLCRGEKSRLVTELKTAHLLATSPAPTVAKASIENQVEMKAEVQRTINAMRLVDYLSTQLQRDDSPVARAAATVVEGRTYASAVEMFDRALDVEEERVRRQGVEVNPSLGVTGGNDKKRDTKKILEAVPGDYFTLRSNIAEVAKGSVSALLRMETRDVMKESLRQELKKYFDGVMSRRDIFNEWLERASGEAGARIVYMVAYVILLAALSVVLVLSAETFWRGAWATRAGRERRWHIGARSVASFAILLMALCVGPMLLGVEPNLLMRFALNELQGDRFAMQLSDRIGLLALLAALAAVAISVVAGQEEVEAWNSPGNGVPPESDKIAKDLARAWEDVQRIGVALAVLLVGVILHAQALLGWPLALLGGCSGEGVERGVAALCRTTSQMITGYGVIASLLLGSFFIPAVVILRGRIEWLARRSSGPGSVAVSQWLEDRGLNVSLSQQAGRLLTVLAPFFAAMFGDRLQGLIGLTGQ